MFMFMENVHEQWSGSGVSKKVHSEKRQFLGSFHKFCLILFSDYNFYEFFMCVLCNFLYSDGKLKWKTRLQAVWFWVCFFFFCEYAEIRPSQEGNNISQSDYDSIWSWLMCKELEPVTSTYLQISIFPSQ